MLNRLSAQQQFRLKNSALAFVGGIVLCAVLLLAWRLGNVTISGALFAAAIALFWIVNITIIACIANGSSSVHWHLDREPSYRGSRLLRDHRRPDLVWNDAFAGGCQSSAIGGTEIVSGTFTRS